MRGSWNKADTGIRGSHSSFSD